MQIVDQETTEGSAGGRLRHDIEGGWIDNLGDGVFMIFRDEQSVLMTREDAELLLSLH